MKKINDYKKDINKYLKKQKIVTLLIVITSLYQITCLLFNNNEDFIYPLRYILLVAAVLSALYMIVEGNKIIKILNE